METILDQQTFLQDLPPITRYRVRRPGVRLATRMIIASLSVMVISLGVYPLLPKVYVSTADLVVQSTSKEGSPTWEQSITSQLDDNAIQTKVDIIRSQRLQLGVVRQNKLMDDPEFNHALQPSWLKQKITEYRWLTPWIPPQPTGEVAVSTALLANLISKRERKSYLLQVGYESHDPKTAAILTNSLVGNYLAEENARKTRSHDNLLAALSERVKKLQASYEASEEVAYRYVVTAGLTHIGEREVWQKELDALGKQMAEAHQRTANLKGRADLFNVTSKAADLDNLSDVINSPILLKLRERYVELSTGAGSSTVPSGASNAVLAVLRGAMQAEVVRIAKAAQSDADLASREEMALRLEVVTLDLKMLQWQDNLRHSNDLGRLVDVAKLALDHAQSDYVQEISRGDALQPDITVIANAEVPLRPVFPSLTMYGAGTLFLIVLINGVLLLPRLMRRVG